MFYQNHSIALHSYSPDIFNFDFKKSQNLDVKNLRLPEWAWVNFMIYWTLIQKIFELLYQNVIRFIIYRPEKYLDYLGFALIL